VCAECVALVLNYFYRDATGTRDGKVVHGANNIPPTLPHMPYRDKGRDWRKCSCPIHLEGYLGDRYVRESLALRSWDVAQARVRELEANALFPEEQKPAPIGIKEATEKFFTGDTWPKPRSRNTTSF